MNKKIIVILFFITLFALPAILFAAGETPAAETPPAAQPSPTTLDNPLGPDASGPVDLYARIIFAFMGLTGVIALLMFIIGGFQWMTAGGAADKVKKGKDTVIWASFGLILIFSSYAILRAIFETLKF